MQPTEVLLSSRSGVARNFKRERVGGHNFYTFSRVFFFFGRTNLKLIEKQERL